MKVFFLTISVICASLLSYAGNIEVYFDHKLYSIPSSGTHYVETHIEFVGHTLQYPPTIDGSRNAMVEVMILIKQNDEIIQWEKLNVEGPGVGLSEMPNFIDVQRFPIEEGMYTFELELKDLNDPLATPLVHTEDFQVNVPADSSYISDISLITAYAKTEDEESGLAHSGYELLPFVSDYFPSSVNSLIFYAEVYHTTRDFKTDEMYLLTYYIQNAETEEVAANQKVSLRQEPSAVTPILATFNLTDLEVGDYEVCIQVRNRNNELVTERKLPFFRQKIVQADSDLAQLGDIEIANTFAFEIEDKDVLFDYIKSCRPKATNVERTTIDYQIPESDISLMQKFFYYFWLKRDALDPESAWLEYKEDVDVVNREYSTAVKRGYESDRGRVYLQYGKPNSMAIKHNNMSIYPYEIWHYYNIGKFNNRRFLFYNTDMVSNDFELLHSDMWGETKNNNWFEIMSMRNTAQTPTIIEQVDSRYSNSGDAELEILKDLYFHTR